MDSASKYCVHHRAENPESIYLYNAHSMIHYLFFLLICTYFFAYLHLFYLYLLRKVLTFIIWENIKMKTKNKENKLNSFNIFQLTKSCKFFCSTSRYTLYYIVCTCNNLKINRNVATNKIMIVFKNTSSFTITAYTSII